MSFGLKTADLEKINSVLKQYSEIKEVILYGSRAKGTYKRGSDIDLTLKGEELDLEDLLNIENLIEDLLLPYKVDLSLYHKIENQDLIDHINRVGVHLK